MHRRNALFAVVLLFVFAVAGARAGQSGPFPQLYGRPTLFCPPGNYAEGLTARIEADALLSQNRTDTNETTAIDDSELYVRCVPCPSDTYSDGSDAWGLEACHPCPAGTAAPGATACA